jgi:hypothetical protein
LVSLNTRSNYTTTIDVPKWLNPAVLPPADVIDGVAAAREDFNEIEARIKQFAADHRDVLERYLPNDDERLSRRHAIDAATGDRDLFDRIEGL